MVGGAQTVGSAGDAACLPACSAAWAPSNVISLLLVGLVTLLVT